MICPHCKNELNETTFINPMVHIQGCQPAWQGTMVFSNLNVAAANPFPMGVYPLLNNAGCAAQGISTFIELKF